MKKKYKYRSKTSVPSQTDQDKPRVSKTSVSAKKRIFLLLGWSIVAIGLYLVLSARFVIYTVWFFTLLLLVSFILYFVTGIKIARYAEAGKGESPECTKLVDRGKMLLVFMIPTIFIIMYDFLSSTIKMFM